MAIGLDQVKKKSSARVKSSKAKTPETEVVASASVDASAMSAPVRPQLRPWSQRGLAKEGRSTKERMNGETHLSDEWMDFTETHDSPLFWIDVSRDSQLALIQDKLMQIEDRAVEILQKPRHLFAKLKSRFSGAL